MKLNMVCETCGSDEVLRDAWAVWDMEAQEWVLDNAFDHARCDACDGECHIIAVEITE